MQGALLPCSEQQMLRIASTPAQRLTYFCAHTGNLPCRVQKYYVSQAAEVSQTWIFDPSSEPICPRLILPRSSCHSGVSAVSRSAQKSPQRLCLTSFGLFFRQVFKRALILNQESCLLKLSPHPVSSGDAWFPSSACPLYLEYFLMRQYKVLH